jgi:hypothetical protein
MADSTYYGVSSGYSVTINDYNNFTTGQCFALPQTDEQVMCNSQHLNIYDPPSIYNYSQYTPLWESVSCLLWNTTLSNRVDVESKALDV